MKADTSELTTIAVHTVAEAYLALLKARGVDHLYVNAQGKTERQRSMIVASSAYTVLVKSMASGSST